MKTSKPKLLAGFGDKNFGKQYRQGNRIYDSEGVGMCLNASPVGNTGGYSYLYVVKSDNKDRMNKEIMENNKNNILFIFDIKDFVIKPFITSNTNSIKFFLISIFSTLLYAHQHLLISSEITFNAFNVF